jgi:hypothetical protein
MAERRRAGLAEFVFARLCGSRDVLAVVLFGSAVRPGVDSFDLDCLYIYRGEPPVLPPAPMEVDVRAYPVDQVEHLVEAGHDLLGWSLRLGELVCERDEFWTRLREKWLSRLPFPSHEVAGARAAQAERFLAELREIGDEDAAAEQLVAAATHRARAALLRANVFPASRPELPGQLRQIGLDSLADDLTAALEKRSALARQPAGGSTERIRDIA